MALVTTPIYAVNDVNDANADGYGQELSLPIGWSRENTTFLLQGNLTSMVR